MDKKKTQNYAWGEHAALRHLKRMARTGTGINWERIKSFGTYRLMGVNRNHLLNLQQSVRGDQR